ncbi:MAG: (d)CMP kinase, partial [Actinomycetota bacterium]
RVLPGISRSAGGRRAMSRRLVITVDGPAGSGKTTVARKLSERLQLRHVDTGAMYRALTLKALTHAVPIDDGAALRCMAEKTEIRLGGGRVSVDGEDVTARIRTAEVNAAVSQLSAHAEVRTWMAQRQRALVGEGHAVVEGRDIGSVVLPDAGLKVFLIAKQAERARRRAAELRAQGIDARVEDVEEELAARDLKDAARAHSPLVIPEGAIVIDSTRHSAEQIVEKILRIWEAKMAPASSHIEDG